MVPARRPRGKLALLEKGYRKAPLGEVVGKCRPRSSASHDADPQVPLPHRAGGEGKYLEGDIPEGRFHGCGFSLRR